MERVSSSARHGVARRRRVLAGSFFGPARRHRVLLRARRAVAHISGVGV